VIDYNWPNHADGVFCGQLPRPIQHPYDRRAWRARDGAPSHPDICILLRNRLQIPGQRSTLAMRGCLMMAVKLAFPLLFAVPSVLIAGSTPSSIALTSSPSTSIYGRPVALLAVVAPPTVTGNVTFYDGTTVLGTSSLAAGQAALTTSVLPFGVRSLRAYYGGDANYASITSAAVAQTVNAVPGGGFQAPVSYSTGAEPNFVAVGDFNGDGKADLVTANPQGNDVSVLLGKGDGTFGNAASFNVGGSPVSAAVGDFNGDGKPDLAVSSANQFGYAGGGSVSLLLGNGDGTFQQAVSLGAGASYGPIAVGDFNGDGKADLATPKGVLIGNGDGTFQPAINYAAGVVLGSIAVGDFNGDGKADLAVGNANNVTVLLGNGDGTFQTAVTYGLPAFADAFSIAVGDFNGDGKADLVTANGPLGNLSVLLGNGDGTFRAAAIYDVDNGNGNVPYAVAVSDFNGDGKADLATANSYNAGVFIGNGDGTFRTPATYGTGAGSIAVGDFNGDGRADLVVGNPGSNEVSILLAIPAAPNLSVVTTDGGNFVQGQSGATYSITVSNVGYAATSGMVTVTDTLPPGLTATNLSGTGWSCAPSTLTCTRGDPLAALASYPAIALTVSVAANAPGGVTNTVSVSGGGGPNIVNSTASDYATTFTSGQVGQAWSSLSPPASTPLSAALLMTDGTVMIHEDFSSNWYRLTPDSFGNYLRGTWSQTAPMPMGYAPDAFSSAVLADGRLVVIGGEYNCPANNISSCSEAETTLGAIYDPTTNTWTPLAPPSGWTEVGDSSNVVLPNGQFLLASQSPYTIAGPGRGAQLASLSPATLTWTNLKGTGKADPNSEEGWTLLPDGTVLTIDVGSGTNSERYYPQRDVWVSAGNTVAPLAGIISDSPEIGPQVLRPDGTVFVAGATGHTGVYNFTAGTWAAGPDFPISNGQQLITSDAPASLLPNGNVLVRAQSINGQSRFSFEFDGARLNPVPDVTPLGNNACGALLLLPTGQVLCAWASLDVYTPTGSPNPAWAPTIATAPSVVQPGQTYSIAGTQFNGLSQAVGFGDDYQGATNYPLVRIINTATGHVFYCRTHNHSTMGVATSSAPVSTQFDVTASIETGPSTLVVVANGIPSKPWNLTVTTAPSGVVPAIKGVEGGGLSVPAVTAISANGYFAIFGANFAPAGTSRQLAPSDVVNGTLPTNLASTCVYVGPTSAFMTYVSPGQINAIAPSLPATGSTSVSVVTNCGAANPVTSPAVNVPVAAASPEFLYWVQNANGQDAVIAVDAAHGDYIGPPGLIPGLTFRPARAGDILTIYGIGFGGTGSGPLPGLIPLTADSVPAGYAVTIGNTIVPVSYVGVTPTIAGLYQSNVTIPAGIAPGNYPIILNVNGISTPSGAFLSIGP
jgi:uncharacterized protein (TIGR03437 family)